MNKALIKNMAKSVHKKLTTSEVPDVSLYIKGNTYKVKQYNDFDEEDTKWNVLCLEFNYIDTKIPTLEEIEEKIARVFTII